MCWALCSPNHELPIVIPVARAAHGYIPPGDLTSALVAMGT